MENSESQLKHNKTLSIVNALLGLFLLSSIFFSYGIGTYFFSKLFVFLCGVMAVFDALPEQTKERPKLYLMYIFTFIWMFFVVGTENAGMIYGQAYNFTGDVFTPILLVLFVLTILWFFVKRK